MDSGVAGMTQVEGTIILPCKNMFFTGRNFYSAFVRVGEKITVVLGYFVFFGIVGPSMYSKAVESIEKEAQNHLITVRDMKKLELEDYFLDHRFSWKQGTLNNSKPKHRTLF